MMMRILFICLLFLSISAFAMDDDPQNISLHHSSSLNESLEFPAQTIARSVCMDVDTDGDKEEDLLTTTVGKPYYGVQWFESEDMESTIIFDPEIHDKKIDTEKYGGQTREESLYEKGSQQLVKVELFSTSSKQKISEVLTCSKGPLRVLEYEGNIIRANFCTYDREGKMVQIKEILFDGDISKKTVTTSLKKSTPYYGVKLFENEDIESTMIFDPEIHDTEIKDLGTNKWDEVWYEKVSRRLVRTQTFIRKTPDGAVLTLCDILHVPNFSWPLRILEYEGNTIYAYFHTYDREGRLVKDKRVVFKKDDRGMNSVVERNFF